MFQHLWRTDESIVPFHTHDDRGFLLDTTDGEVLSGPREAGRRLLARHVDRRTTLAGLAGLAACGAMTAWDPLPRYAFAAGSGTRDTLVVVFLRGGMDGLQVVVPYGDPGYALARPTLGVPASAVVRVDDVFGLHPQLAAKAKPLWDAGELAAVVAAGNPAATRSHFDAQADMERAAPASVRSGWLARHLAATSTSTDLVRAITVGTSATLAASGAFPTAAIGSRLKDFDLEAWSGYRAQAQATLTAMARSAGGAVAQNTELAFGAIASLASARALSSTPANGASYPSTSFGRSLAEVAKVIRAGAPVEAACVDVGNWDMHRGQGSATDANGWMSRNLLDLGGTLAAFRTDIGDAWARTTVVMMTEFGRRVGENSTNGADHGHGGLMLVAGGGIVGGRVYGAWPGVGASQLVDGDLAVANDYRQVIGEILLKRAGASSLDPVFPGLSYVPLGLTR